MGSREHANLTAANLEKRVRRLEITWEHRPHPEAENTLNAFCAAQRHLLLSDGLQHGTRDTLRLSSMAFSRINNGHDEIRAATRTSHATEIQDLKAERLSLYRRALGVQSTHGYCACNLNLVDTPDVWEE